MSNIDGAERFVDWWKQNRRSHKTFPFKVSYHPRSDEHSKILCMYVLEDLVKSCETMRRHALDGSLCYDVNHEVYRRDGTKKVLDLVIGQPAEPLTGAGIRRGKVTTPGIRVALEAKACMTKHHSAMPRLRDELAGSMGSAIEASAHAIVCGVVVVNVASRFLSPTDQPDPLPLDPSALRRRDHTQPQEAAFVVDSLGRLPFRQKPPDIGFDSMGIIVVRNDNDVPQPDIALVLTPPSPQPTNPRNYRSFIIDVGNKYKLRFSD